MEGTPLWEDVLLIVAIFMLLPFAFKQPYLVSYPFMLLSLIITVIVLIRRIKRWRSLGKDENKI